MAAGTRPRKKNPLKAGAEVVGLTSAARPTDTISHGAMAAVWRPIRV
jgi:hypothetical protein